MRISSWIEMGTFWPFELGGPGGAPPGGSGGFTFDIEMMSSPDAVRREASRGSH